MHKHTDVTSWEDHRLIGHNAPAAQSLSQRRPCNQPTAANEEPTTKNPMAMNNSMIPRYTVDRPGAPGGKHPAKPPKRRFQSLRDLLSPPTYLLSSELQVHERLGGVLSRLGRSQATIISGELRIRSIVARPHRCKDEDLVDGEAISRASSSISMSTEELGAGLDTSGLGRTPSMVDIKVLTDGNVSGLAVVG